MTPDLSVFSDRLFCVLTVHGTFDGDDGSQKSEVVERVAEPKWWSDDEASNLDKVQDDFILEQRRIGFLRLGKIKKCYKVIEPFASNSQIDRAATIPWKGENGVENFQERFEGFVEENYSSWKGDGDAFVGVPGHEKLSCLAQALALIDVRAGTGKDRRIIVRAVRWPHQIGWRRLISKLQIPVESFEIRSGANSEYARKRAARQLAEEMLFLEKMKIDYVVVGHSHGGTIAHDALRHISEGKRKHLRSLITFGAPIIRVRSNWLKLRPLTFLPSFEWLSIILASSVFGYLFHSGFSFKSLAALAVFLFVMLLCWAASQWSSIATRIGDHRINALKDSAVHLCHKDDEIVSAFEKLANGGSTKIAKQGKERLALTANLLRILSLITVSLSAISMVWVLSGLNTVVAQVSGINILGGGAALLDITAFEEAFCTPSLSNCDFADRFDAVRRIGGVTAIGVFVFFVVRILWEWWTTGRAISSGIRRAISVFVMGMGWNQEKVSKIGADRGSETMEKMNEPPDPGARYTDVAEAINAVRVRALPEFGALFTDLPANLAQSGSGEFRHWSGYLKKLMKSEGIIHNAYGKSETFLLLLAKLVSKGARYDLRPYAGFFEYADLRAFERDYSAYFQNLGLNQKRNFAQHFTKPRSHSWLAAPKTKDSQGVLRLG
jgi:hypothetical protein